MSPLAPLAVKIPPCRVASASSRGVAKRYLAIALARLDDFENACSAYEKAMDMEEDHMTHLNFAITLHNFGETARAREEFDAFQRLFQQCGPDVEHDEDVINQSNALRKVLVPAAD